MKRRTVLGSLLPVTGVVSLLRSRPTMAGEPPGVTAGLHFPDIIYQTEDGKRHTIAEASGKAVLVYLWAVWCPICYNDIVNIQYYYGKFQNNPRFATIGLNFMDAYEPAVRWARSRGITFPLGDCGIHTRSASIATTTAGPYMLPRATPQLYLLDRNGVVAYTTNGHENTNFPAVTKEIDSLLSV